jgi:periplasmic copper chaperone A
MKRLIAALIATGFLMPLAEACDVRVDSGWIRHAPPTASSWAGYVQIHNDGTDAVRFERLSSPQFGSVELHETVLDNGVMKMRGRDSLEIAPGESVALKPSGLHLMLSKPSERPTLGDRIAVTLHSDNACDLDLVLDVRDTAPDGSAPAADDHAHHQHH